MKNVKKLLRKFAGMALVAGMALGLVACGGNKDGSAATISNTYNLNRAEYIDGIGWYQNETFTLELNADDTYQLYFNTVRFGAEDCDMRGLRTITYSGTYTVADSTDGEPSHKDVTLSAPTQITWDQQGKGFTRVQTLPGNFFINTSEWTDAMTAQYDPEGNSKGAEEFLAEFGVERTITVENPSVSPDDTTLAYRIVTAPDMGIMNESEQNK